MLNRIKAQFITNMLVRFSSRGTMALVVLANSLILTLTYFFWNAFYESSNSSQIYTFSRNTLLIYTVVAVILRSNIVTFSTTIRLGNMVKDGSITSVLLKPFYFLEYWVFDQVSRIVFSLFTLTIPLVFLMLVMDSSLLNTKLNLARFFLSAIIGAYISNILNITMGLLSFWFEKSDAIHQLNVLLYELASGVLIPLAMYPNFIKNIMNYLPYKSIIDIPLNVLLYGDSSLIKLQLLWAFIITSLYFLIFRMACKRLEVVGI